MTRRTMAVGLGAVLALLLGTGAAAVPPSPSVELMPGTEGMVYNMAVTGDTIYTLSYDEAGGSAGDNPLRDSLLYSRSVTEGVDGYQLGAATRVTRASGYSMAEHDGTLGYLRRVDGRLVLRAEDGTETLPTWGNDDEIVAFGPHDMSANWFSAGGWIWDRATGTKHNLTSLVPDLPASPDWVWSDSASITDTRALWEAYWCEGETMCDGGVFTVALGASGPTGSVVKLPGAGYDSWAVGIIDDSLVWATWLPNGVSISAVPVSNPTATPTIRAIVTDDWAPVFDARTSVVISQWNGVGAYRADWFDPAHPGTDLHTYTQQPDHQAWGAYDTLLWLYDWTTRQDLMVDVDGSLTANSSIPAKSGAFNDVPASNGFVEDIRWLADLKITTGYDDGTFHPTDAVSRQAMAAFLYRFAGSPDYTPPATSPFADVPTTHPFYKPIAWLAAAGISTGTTTPTGTYFKPADPVSRQAMAAFLYRFAGSPAYTPPGTTPFVDVGTAHQFYKPIAWLADTRISTGTTTPSGALFAPGNAVSRQAMAAFLHRQHTGGHTVIWVAATPQPAPEAPKDTQQPLQLHQGWIAPNAPALRLRPFAWTEETLP